MHSFFGFGFVVCLFVWGLFHQRSAENAFLVAYLILLPHIPAFFVTSLTQTAGHKVAAITVCVDFQTSICNRRDQK